MVNRTTSSIYTIVEKTYYRLQAGDVLTHCIEDGSSAPIHEMIQEMVIAGPQSLDALREILGETIKRKSQVHDDLSQVINQLSIILKGYGLIEMMNTQELFEADTRTGCLQVLMDSKELITTLDSKIQLLENIENYLQDWLWGLTYQSIREGADVAGTENMKAGLL
jgi:hypothetical protein